MQKRAIFGFSLILAACSSTGTGTMANTPQDSGANTSVGTDVKTDSGVTAIPDSSVPPVTKPDASPDRIAVGVPDTRPATAPDTAPMAEPDAQVPVDLQPVVTDTAPSPVVDAYVPQVPDVAPVVDLVPVVPDLAQGVPDLQMASPDVFSSPDVAPVLTPDAMVLVDLQPAAPDVSLVTCGLLNQRCCTPAEIPDKYAGCRPSLAGGLPYYPSWTSCLDPNDLFAYDNQSLVGTCQPCGDVNGPACMGVNPATGTSGNFFCKNGLFAAYDSAKNSYWCRALDGGASPDAALDTTPIDTMLADATSIGGLNQPCGTTDIHHYDGLVWVVGCNRSNCATQPPSTFAWTAEVFGCVSSWTTCFVTLGGVVLPGPQLGEVVGAECLSCGGEGQAPCYGLLIPSSQDSSNNGYFCRAGLQVNSPDTGDPSFLFCKSPS